MADSFVRSVERALKILLAFSVDEPELSISELSNKLGLSPSTVHRLLQTLQKYDFVAQEESHSNYRLGLALFKLGALVQHMMTLQKQAHGSLNHLSQSTGDIATLYIVDNNQALCIDHSEGHFPISVTTMRVGYRLPLNCGGAPRVLLAYQSDEEIERLIREGHLVQMTPKASIEPDDLWRDVEAIRERGYSIAVDDVVEDTAAIGAPIRDNHGNVIGALSVVTITPRFSEERQPELIKLVVEQANAVSFSMGWSGD